MIMIMFHHCSQYMGSINRVGSYFKKYGFIFTGVFLFLSGYVSCYSLQIKAESKLDILKWFICRVKAIYKILIPSFLALLPIIIWVKNIEANFIYEMFYSLLTITLPVTRLWYIKVQVLLYGILALAFTVDQNKKVGMSLIIMDGLIVLAMRYYFMLPNIWWNTQLCFCVGVIYRLYQDIIDMYLEKNFIAWITICICLEWYFHDEIILAIISCLFVIAINKKGWSFLYTLKCKGN